MNAVQAAKTPLLDDAKQALREQPRFALSAEGSFTFANPAFFDLAGLTANTPLSELDVTQFLDDVSFADIESGVRYVRFNEREVAFYFDWLDTSRGRYLVASSDVVAGIVDADIGIQQNTQPDFPASLSLKPDDMLYFDALQNNFTCVVHPDSGIMRVNKAMFERFGFGASEFLGKNIVDLIAPVDRQLMLDTVMQLFDLPEGELGQVECRVDVATGEQVSVLWRLCVQNGVLYATGRDRTDAKLEEAAYKRREHQLSEAQALAHMGHWRWEVGADFIEWSDELYNIFGLTAESFKPSMEGINTLVHRRDLGRLYQAFQRAIIQQHDYEMDFRAIRPDGTTRMVRCEGRCELDNEGEVVALYGIMQDITHQKEHEQALREAKDAAESAYASKSRFLANMSHELRTPLNAIIGFSDLMEKQILGPIGNPQYIEYIKSVRESGEHLLDLITDILDMSKIESGKYELSLEPINIVQVCRTSLQMMAARAAQGNITLDGDLPDDGVQIVADRRAVKQILLNLLSNALKFTDAGGRVDLRFEQTASAVIIEVEDTGIGIPAHKINDVTKPFEQVSNAFTRRHEGSGLGLAITKELVELHGGSLTIDSRLGQGTRVRISIPLY